MMKQMMLLSIMIGFIQGRPSIQSDSNSRKLQRVGHENRQELELFPIVDFGADKHWVIRFKIENDILDSISDATVSIDSKILSMYEKVYSKIQFQFVVDDDGKSYSYKVNRKIGSIMNSKSERSSVRLTSSNINKLKTKIFDAGNIVEGGEGDGFSYKLEDSPPVLTLGLNSIKNLSTRRAQNAIKSRRRRSHHSRGFCGEVYEYIVQMKIYRDDVAVIYPRNIDIGTCTLPSAIKSQKSKETRFFEANRLQCAHTNLKLNENPHAYLRKHADSAHKHENNLLCVPDQYENHQFFLNNIQQELPMKLKSCTCR